MKKRKKNPKFLNYPLLIKSRKGNILVENLIFIILNVLFLAILVGFLFSKTGSAAVLEEKYSKKIALLIDSAEPLMTIRLEMEDALKMVEKNNFPKKEIVQITENIVTVKLREKGGYSYSFFNDVKPNENFDKDKSYFFVIEEND